MRWTSRTWWAVVPAVLLTAGCLGGCGSHSIAPGIGTTGGLGTPGGGTGNPDATMIFRLQGIPTGDFNASDISVNSTAIAFIIQGTVKALPPKNVLRVATLRFQSLPVANHTYTVGATGTDGVSVQYAEQNQATSTPTTSVWNGVSGSVHVDKVTSDHIDGTFSAALNGAQNATGQITMSEGEFHVKIYQ